LDLFEYSSRKFSQGHRPLAERMRPRKLSAFVGQAHVVGEEKPLRRMIEADRIFSMILWGPPGCGKTTLAGIIARETRSCFIHFSAVLSGIREIRDVIRQAKDNRDLHRGRTILFVDEIHRFNKAQQDAFLPHVESGLIILIGATTENPSFEVIPPLMSRCRVFTLHPLSRSDIERILRAALIEPQDGLGKQRLRLRADALAHLADVADGDARLALNFLEQVVSVLRPAAGSDDAGTSERRVTLAEVENAVLRKSLRYDKTGEEHYNLISAFHKSMRGGDPDAAAYWLCRMLAAGEDPMYISRRMVRFASEDVGNADPQALQVALNATEAYRLLGSPEGDLALVQGAVYLACAPKSNRLYAAHQRIKAVVDRTGSLPTPLHIRNAPTRLMKNLGYGRGYQYPPDAENGVVDQEYLPRAIRHERFYIPGGGGYERRIQHRLTRWCQQKRHLRRHQSGTEEQEEKQ